MVTSRMKGLIFTKPNGSLSIMLVILVMNSFHEEDTEYLNDSEILASLRDDGKDK